MRKKFRLLFHRFRLTASWLILLSALVVFGCSSGGDGGSVLQTGVFTDAFVSGLDYRGPATLAGTTNAQGQFSYRPGDTITFSIGSLVLGSATGAAQMTPLSITSGAASASDQRVNNKLVLLQTLDQDGDLNNGIQITAAARAIVSAQASSINFDQTTAAFSASLSTLMTALNGAGVFTDAAYRGLRTVKSATRALDHFTRATSDRVAFNTTYGPISCYQPGAGYVQCLGIPYARPPIGDLRWRNPENPIAWTQTRDAVNYPDQAPQAANYASSGEGEVSEDCLYLNVTAPSGATGLPVMVWLHGGAFGILTSSTKNYNNHLSLPTKGVVLVTVNHRLGPFGYMAHPWLTAEQGQSGNYGQRDLIKALEWVRDNIATFGGDPNNVTIFGQSGGGGKSISLMASPLAAGLFHKVICQSGMAPGDALNHSTLAVAEAKGSALTNNFVNDLAAFRAKTWQEIITEANNKWGSSDWVMFTPNQDGVYLTDTMENLIKAGLASDVPFMGGSVDNDVVGGADLAPGVTQQMPWRKAYNTAAQYVYKWSFVPGTATSGWLALDPPVRAYHGIELVYTFNYGMSFATHQYLNLTNKTDAEIGVTQSRDDMTIWGYYVLLSTGYFDTFPTPSAASLLMTDQAMTLWSNFAKSGNPNTPLATGLVTWNPFTVSGEEYFEIGNAGCEMKAGLVNGFGPVP